MRTLTRREIGEIVSFVVGDGVGWGWGGGWYVGGGGRGGGGGGAEKSVTCDSNSSTDAGGHEKLSKSV